MLYWGLIQLQQTGSYHIIYDIYKGNVVIAISGVYWYPQVSLEDKKGELTDHANIILAASSPLVGEHIMWILLHPILDIRSVFFIFPYD